MEEANLPKRYPIAWILVALNAGIILILLLSTARFPFGTVLALFSTILFVGVSAIWQLGVFFVDRKFRLHRIFKCIAYLLPAISLVCLPFLGITPSRAPNKQRPAISLSENYTATISAPGSFWKIKIVDTDGGVFEETTEFVGYLNVYWIWDKSDRLWLYNSDDGGVHYWHRLENQWVRKTLSRTHDMKITGDIPPPDELFPDSIRNRKDSK